MIDRISSEWLNRALTENESVYIRVKPQVEGVCLPPHLMKEDAVVLQLGLNMPNPIRDLRVTDWGVMAVLSFSGSGFRCAWPWGAVWGAAGSNELAPTEPKPKRKPHPHLRLVK